MPAQELHGTVNIAVANGNGLVAVTDSKLSSGNTSVVEYGQKLFQVDDHTICMVAGFYTDPGPTVSGNIPHPAYTTIPLLMNQYIENLARAKKPLSIIEKLTWLSNLLSFDLTALSYLNRVAGRPDNPSDSQLTIAGYDNGRLVIASTAVKSMLIGKSTEYVSEPDKPQIHVVNDTFTNATAGIDELVKDVLSFPERYTQIDPIFGVYARSMKENQGRSLSLDNLNSIAEQLERMTALKYTAVVGGTRERAILKGGKVSLFEPGEFNPVAAGEFNRFILIDSDSRRVNSQMLFSQTRQNMVVLVSQDYFDGGTILLDHTVITGSTFRNCKLLYLGDFALFDTTNDVKNCSLVLGNNFVTNSDFVKASDFINKLLSNYPEIKVEVGYP